MIEHGSLLLEDVAYKINVHITHNLGGTIPIILSITKGQFTMELVIETCNSDRYQRIVRSQKLCGATHATNAHNEELGNDGSIIQW